MRFVIDFIFGVYTTGLIVYVVLSWFKSPEVIRVRKWLSRFYDPLLEPIRSRLKPFTRDWPVDISPIILLFGIALLERVAFMVLVG